ncbi:MAG: 3-methyl-2-oxobutanoate dehydrogenase subunit beta, partial [Clostridia bacterium]|nr:3-methyl-2-oxobutanoate dehydrogenase subunit beta [Clostridia bacterium]
DIVLVAFGITARICKSAIAELREAGIKAGLLRPITLWPFPKKVLGELADKTKAFLSVEMSMGQMVDDVRLAVNGKKPVHFFGRTGGVIPSVEEVVAETKKLAETL